MPDTASTGHLHGQRFQTVQSPDAARLASEKLNEEQGNFKDSFDAATHKIKAMQRQAEGFLTGGLAGTESGGSQVTNFVGGNPLQAGGASSIGNPGQALQGAAAGASSPIAGEGADVTQLNADNPILDSFLDAVPQLQSAMGKLGAEVMAMIQALMGGLNKPETSPEHISKWDDRTKYDMLNKMRRHAPRVADAHHDISNKHRVPVGPEHRQELSNMHQETTQTISVFAASYVHFAMEGYVEAGEGLAELHKELDTHHDGASDPTLAAQQASGSGHAKMMFSFEMTVVTFFQMTITQTEKIRPEVEDRVQTVQDKLRNYFENADSESANRVLAQINDILQNEEARKAEELAAAEEAAANEEVAETGEEEVVAA